MGIDWYPIRLVSPHMHTVTLKNLIDMGFGDRLCPSHDCICLHIHKERPDSSIPDEHEFTKINRDQYFYIHRHVIPDLLKMGVPEDQIQQLFVDNPRRFFKGS